MKRNRPSKNEITLMTLLANESATESRKLLKKYNKPDAKDCADLEVKLAQLYFDTPDKLAIEKELAAIHPHKDWLLKRTKVEEVEKPVVIEVDQKTSNADGGCNNPNCPVHGQCVPVSNYDGIPSNPTWQTDEQKMTISERADIYNREHPYQMFIPIIGFVTIIGFMTYLLKSNKTQF